MKKVSFVIALAATTWLLMAADSTTTPAASKPAASAAAPKASPLIGTWENVTADYRALKHITDSSIIWVHINPQTKEIMRMMGGKYKHEGDDYTETMEYGSAEMKDFVGQPFKFKAKMDGADKWNQSGKVGDFDVNENWTRVK